MSPRRYLPPLLLALLLAAPVSPAAAMPAQDAPAAAGSSTMPAMPSPASTTAAPAAPHVRPKAVSASTSSMPGMPATSGAMPEMDHGSMPGMDHSTMPGMDHSTMPGMDHGSMQGMNHGAMSGTTMGPMQGGNPPSDARDPDYSAGAQHPPDHGIDMAMDDNARIGMLLVDQLEAFHGMHGSGQQWDIEGRYGNDYDKLWLRTEGERSGGRLEDASVEAFWNHAVAPFWSTQLGVRSDVGEGPGRQWAAFGLQGLAPYWFELEATGYVGPSGRTAVRLRAEYELLFTQRLVLQPQFEANAYGKADPARRLGSGLADASFGLRLRYEFHRQFAPYVGIVWTRRFGATAGFAREDGHGRFDRQWVAGVRIWF